ncbi:MAG: esterase, partial [Bacteroidaceae bacterium]|nr:esterase [Bacteroidaceae bacterium]
MMRLVYFHGFMSSGASGTVESLRRMLPELEVCAPDIPVDPVDALPYLRQYCQEHKPDIIVGTSMGAMYAQQMFGFRKICVNPSFNMSTMSKVMKAGTTYPFQNGRKDGQ